MKSSLFLAIVILAGTISGIFVGSINLILIEPMIDKAISIETQNSIEQGEIIDSNEQLNYRIWQKSGEIIASLVIGISLASLFGIIFAYSRNILPGNTHIKKAIVLASIMCITLFIIPALKYPANPPAVGDPETISYRQSLYVMFLSTSGITAFFLGILYGKKIIKRKILLPVIYSSIMLVSFLVFPQNPDKILISMDLVQNFRSVTMISMSVLWISIGITLGILWDRYKPHETIRMTTV